MGEIVQDNSDIMIVTDDDPDTENRFSIIQQVVQNVSKKTLGKDYFILPERKLAIKFALESAQVGDIVMFAGKGHELVQYTNLERRPWSDVEEIERNG